VRQFGDRPVTAIDEFMVDEGLHRLSRRLGPQGRPLTGSTINRYKSKLSAVFIHFIQHPDYKRLGFTNPVRKESVSRYRENPAKDRFLDADEQAALLAACRESHWDRCYLLVLMALTTGARKGSC
jgi:integrase